MIKTTWNWLVWKFYKRKGKRLFALNQQLVQSMTMWQRLDYAMHALRKGHMIWDTNNKAIDSQVAIYMMSLDSFCDHADHKQYSMSRSEAKGIHKISVMLNLIARGKMLKGCNHPMAHQELAYALWEVSQMLGIMYPDYDKELSSVAKVNRGCSDDEAMARMAQAVIGSVAAAYGHMKGNKAYCRAYEQMLEHGKSLKI